MSELVGGIGEGRVLVFQPATPRGAGIEVALGIQRLWQRTLKDAGRPAASLLMLTRVESLQGVVPEGMPIAVGDRNVGAIADWSEPRVTATLVQQKDARWGLCATFIVEAETVKLSTELFEAQPGEAPSTLATWSFDGGSERLPAHVVEVVVETARRVGTRLPWSTATEAFDTSDPIAALYLLEQLGVSWMAQEGCRLEVARVLARLAGLVGAAPRSRVVIALVPDLLAELARLGAHDLQLAGWVRGVRQTVGTLPSEWDGLLEKISRAR